MSQFPVPSGPPTSRDEQASRLAESLRRQLGAYCALLEERDVVEISLNADSRVWDDRLSQPMEPVGTMCVETAEAPIATVASIHRTVVTRDQPLLQCRLPLDGSRFQASLSPVSAALTFSIRRHASGVLARRIRAAGDHIGGAEAGDRGAAEHSRLRWHGIG